MTEQFGKALDNYLKGVGWPSLTESVAHVLGIACTRTGETRITFGLDECAKNPAIVAATDWFARFGLSLGTRPLWWQLRENDDGTPFFLVPATRRVPWRDGRAVPGSSCPDSH